MARPTKEVSQRRGDQLNIRLTAGERVRLEYKAACLGITLAEFIRTRGLGYRLRAGAARHHADSVAIAALNRLGVNLNQMTHHLNAGWSLTPGTDAALQDLLGDIQTAMRGLMHGPKTDSRRPVL